MREPRGKILLETIKSQKSSQVVPSANGWKWKTLKPRAVVSARRKTPHITALIFVNHGIYPVSVFYAGKAQGLIGQHGKEPVIVLGGSQCVKVR